MHGGNTIPVYSQTSYDWHNAFQQPSYAVNLDVGINEYVFGRTTPNNKFIVSTGLINDPIGVQMVGGKKVKPKMDKEVKPKVDKKVVKEVKPKVDKEVKSKVDKKVIKEVKPKVDKKVVKEVKPKVDKKVIKEVKPKVDKK